MTEKINLDYEVTHQQNVILCKAVPSRQEQRWQGSSTAGIDAYQSLHFYRPEQEPESVF